MPSVTIRTEDWIPEPMKTFSQGGYIIPDRPNPYDTIQRLQHDNAMLSAQLWKLKSEFEQLTQVVAGVMEYIGLNPRKPEEPAK